MDLFTLACPHCGQPLNRFFVSRTAWLTRGFMHESQVVVLSGEYRGWHADDSEFEAGSVAGFDAIYSCGHCDEDLLDQEILVVLREAEEVALE